jgi:hypothetical protein
MMSNVGSEPGPQSAEVTGDVVSVLGLEDTEPGRPDRWTLKRSEDWRLGRVEMPVDVLKSRVSRFLDSMREVITDLPAAFGRYELDQVTISAEVSAKGQISLLGSGGELAGKSGLTFTFTRRLAKDGSPSDTHGDGSAD